MTTHELSLIGTVSTTILIKHSITIIKSQMPLLILIYKKNMYHHNIPILLRQVVNPTQT